MSEEKNEDTRTDGRAWVGVDKAWVAVDTPNGRTWLAFDTEYRGRSGFFSYGNELNRGMRAKSGKNQHAFAPAFPVMKQQDLPASLSKETTIVPDREKYNQPDFLKECADAKFFVIKSYNEDNIHKSIKYNMWVSTKKGNKKLDVAYQEAQQRPGRCPVFLFFSVNTSCQFVGLAEMIRPVKDVSNNLLRHVTLENNKNKPVT
ncbi:YTH domain-containing family protein 2-like [Vigna radiata var. radiata]|uniref:YTH domain-containing family protein n=1 Tax=Vigna radiata var. radiata TaxID=3916 RepID=A0A3Q0F3N4_VIGRR|nr:YTH domain-containing family protein 2-like [Vigna radiata var. radiata]